MSAEVVGSCFGPGPSGFRRPELIVRQLVRAGSLGLGQDRSVTTQRPCTAQQRCQRCGPIRYTGEAASARKPPRPTWSAFQADSEPSPAGLRSDAGRNMHGRRADRNASRSGPSATSPTACADHKPYLDEPKALAKAVESTEDDEAASVEVGVCASAGATSASAHGSQRI